MNDAFFWILFGTGFAVFVVLLVGTALDEDEGQGAQKENEDPLSKKTHYLTMHNLELTAKLNTLRADYQNLSNEYNILKSRHNRLVRKSNRQIRRRRTQ